jgi:hypothetical protein
MMTRSLIQYTVCLTGANHDLDVPELCTAAPSTAASRHAGHMHVTSGVGSIGAESTHQQLPVPAPHSILAPHLEHVVMESRYNARTSWTARVFTNDPRRRPA